MNQKIVPTDILLASEKFVCQLLKKLEADYRYHNLEHTLQVRDIAVELGEAMQLSEEELEILTLAALFHDTGFTKQYLNHETESAKIATEYLQDLGYAQENIERVTKCIKATHSNAIPETTLQKIIKDADLSNLASDNYWEGVNDLRHEWEVILNQKYTDEEWNAINFRFFKDHDYYTNVAIVRFGQKKKANQKILKKMVKKKKATNGNGLDVKQGIKDNKSAQMMFKTALRNHLDLSNLADNKANIMLSVNALIITIVMPLAASYVQDENSYILAPLSALLITCLVSMIYATLATRPIKMQGYTDAEKIQEGRSNLFFFGNFYKMSLDEYNSGMKKVINNDESLENSIVRDLYFLGRSLGKKYSQLRTCYTIFMVGVIMTVIIFAITYGIDSLSVR